MALTNIIKQPLNGILHRMLMAVAPGYAERMERERLFNEIVRLHDNLILRLCFGYAGTESELEDLHQDALVNIWLGLPEFRSDSSLKTWIYRVTLNTCVSTVRARSRHIETMPIEDMVEVCDGAEEKLRMLRELHAAIGLLSPTDKAVVLLWLDGMSYEEIAGLTGLQRSNVGTRIHRAKEKLRKLL